MVDYDPFSDAILDDPLPVYRALREESPVHYLPAHDSWALSRFEDVWNAGQDPKTFASPGPSLTGSVFASEMDDAFPERGSIFSMNPPSHTDLRRLLAPHFAPGAVRRLEQPVREAVRACIDRLAPTGHCDAIADLAGQISVKVACLIIGLPLEDGDALSRVVARFFSREEGVQGMPPDAIAAAGELREYVARQVEERRRKGSDRGDIIDTYLGAAIDDAPFTDEELSGHMMTLIVGGTETLPKVFAGGILQLAKHPEQRAALVADPSLIPAAFNEIARYEMPTQFLTRRVARDVELHGQKLREDQGVLFLYRSANRDEREFDDPDRFDVRRRAPRILSFGHGTHICLGQHAARLEARIMYEELLARIPEYEVVESEVVPARSEFVAGYLAMPMHFPPA
jgi:cytochrome P450